MSLLIARALYQSGRNYVSNQIERGERKVAEVIADGKEVLAEVLDAGKEIVADGFRADGPAAHLEGRAVLLGCDQVEVEEPTCEDLEGFETCLSHEEWFRNDRPETDVNEVVTVSVPKGMINDADVWEYIVPQAFPGASLDEAEVAKFADTLRDTQRAVNPQDGKGLPIENMYVEDNSAYWGLKGRAAHPRFSINVPSALAMATDVNSLEIAKNACETWIDKLAPRKDDERISAAYEKLLERFEIVEQEDSRSLSHVKLITNQRLRYETLIAEAKRLHGILFPAKVDTEEVAEAITPAPVDTTPRLTAITLDPSTINSGQSKQITVIPNRGISFDASTTAGVQDGPGTVVGDLTVSNGRLIITVQANTVTESGQRIRISVRHDDRKVLQYINVNPEVRAVEPQTPPPPAVDTTHVCNPFRGDETLYLIPNSYSYKAPGQTTTTKFNFCDNIAECDAAQSFMQKTCLSATKSLVRPD